MFQQARPIFPAGKSETMNTFAVFRARIPSLVGARLHITAAYFYRVSVNGRFLAFGPARAAKGYAREDVLDLSACHLPGGNVVTVEVAGYYNRSLSTVFQPSYLLAEIEADGAVLAATGRDFEAFLPATKIREVERYSYQRHFSEVWDLTADPLGKAVPVEEVAAPQVLDRVAPYPHYGDVLLPGASCRGKLVYDETLPVQSNFYSGGGISERWGCFSAEQIVYRPYGWIQSHRQEKTADAVAFPFTLRAGEYAVLDFSRIETGFLHLLASSAEGADLAVGFSEDGAPDRFAYTNIHAHNALEVILPAGETDFLSFEPYTVRYAIVAVKSGSVTLRRFGVKTFEHDTSGVKIPPIADPTLKSIYRAAVRTFAHNAVDIFTDCPSRERAGWLCDSYFTSKVEYALFGSSPVESAFLENYRLFRNDGDQLLPDGAIPMCYPSDLEDPGKCKFIPQWAMWFLVELEEHLNRRAPGADREAFRPVVEGLLSFFARHENADGLLEKLPSWNFVEWSDANKWTQDVNYPTNFLYAQVLESCYRMFGNVTLHEKAAHVRKVTAEQAFDGRVFLDHAVRDENGVLVRQPHCSEAGQYYAILFGDVDLADPKYAELRRLVLHVFGPVRKEEIPEIIPINAFIGAYLRLEALLKLKEYDLLLSDISEFFGQMDRDTGTLWEYRERKGSRDHGFASYALVAMTEALKATGRL